ncbi:MAG TPA: hypothetical protein VFW11_22265 [Cyclobacteriaceae bacterium]|nr:hypothetical protein [Cyclobacteriaceae bacterium]
MMTRVAICFIGVAICYACGNAENAGEADSITGTYVREYSREIINQLDGNMVGMRTVRDTLYITSVENGYKVRNSKWSMNDYDDDGWQNMEHGESGPLPSFTAKYDKTSRTLTSETARMTPDLVIAEDGKLSIGSKSEVAFTKID